MKNVITAGLNGASGWGPGGRLVAVARLVSCLATAIVAVSPLGCVRELPADEYVFQCDPDADDCGAGAVCVKAGSIYVCSMVPGCWAGCGENKACVDGECICYPLNCNVRDCGDDECGGSCGTCETDEWCDAGTCVVDCAGLECGPGPVLGQSCGSCETDEWCDAGTCVVDCAGLECGPGPHGGSCGTCETNEWCDAGKCVVDCAGLECGPGPVLGQSCGTCPVGLGCSQNKCLLTGPMLLIPAGSYWMGCYSAVYGQCVSDESPYHEVTLSGYYMDKTEVTQGEYKKCVDAGECAQPDCEWWNPGTTPNRPVVCVDWSMAGEYCEWAGKRLPSEAEWERAARGTDGRKYPWGNEAATCEYAVMYDGGYGCGTGAAMDVCSKSPAGDSPYGLCDMSGNVWEWVSDWYDGDYYDISPASDPTGPGSGSCRGTRGGGFYDDFGSVYASNRNCVVPSNDSDVLGFRCARDAQ